MKLTVLVENQTLIDHNFTGEPGLSFLIEDEGKKILFDLGYSQVFLRNADLMNISLLDVDDVILSHGHLDHTWGLQHLIERYTTTAFQGKKYKRSRLIAHPLVFSSRKVDAETAGEEKEIGSLMQPETLNMFFDVTLSAKPLKITRNLLYLGEIERKNNFEAKKPLGKIDEKGVMKDDFIMDDTALVYRAADGLVIITGCSHAGICNIMEYAQEICGEKRIIDVIGGFHLLKPGPGHLQGTLDFIKKVNPQALHACHCTDLSSKIALSSVAKLEEVGVGSIFEYH